MLRQGCVVLLVVVAVMRTGGAVARAESGQEPAKLASDAKHLFKKYCAQCHHGEKPESGVEDFDVLDHKSLTKSHKSGDKEVFYVRAEAKGEESLKSSNLWKRAGIAGVAGATGDMPPDDAQAKPSDEEHKVLQKWIAAGAPAWETPATDNPKSAANPKEATESQLWVEVREIFEQKCMKCHDGPNPQSGVNELQIVNYESLRKTWKGSDRGDRITEWSRDPWSYVKAGQKGQEALDASLLYHLIKTDRMPRGSEKLSAGEKAIIKAWITGGSQIPPPAAPRTKLSAKAHQGAMLKHLQGASEKDRQYLRYFSFLHLHNNNSIYERELRSSRAGLAKLLNSLTWESKIVVPQVVPDTFETLVVVDLRQLGWDPQKVWEEVIKSYPYAAKQDLAEEQSLVKLCGSRTPCLRADWFVMRASRPPLYHSLLGLGDSSSDLEKQLGIDFRENFKSGRMARAGYLGASTTTSGFRVVERQKIEKYPGAYWKSYDFGSDELAKDDYLQRNPLQHALGPDFKGNPYSDKAFRHDGGEVIFNLPNGMQAYLVVDGEGRRMDAPPIWILKDKNEFAGTPQIVNGISCMACHSQGMQTVSDQVARQTEKGEMRRGGDTLRSRWLLGKLYVPKQEMDDLLKADQKRFLDAVNTATKPFLTDANGRVENPKIELIYGVTQRYRQHVGLEDVACELGYDSSEKLRTVLTKEPRLLKGLGIQYRLLQPGGKISREEWVKAFGTTVSLLEQLPAAGATAAAKEGK